VAFFFALKAFDLMVFATTICTQLVKTSSNWVCLSWTMQLLGGNNASYTQSKIFL